MNQRGRYQPNISHFLNLCGRNYVRLVKLLPDELTLGVNYRVQGAHGVLLIKLLEQTPYTEVIEVSRSLGDTVYIPMPVTYVRIFHDAKLAEVLTSQQILPLQAVYDYPNLRMYHRDEKYQVNAFLEELLKIDRQFVYGELLINN